MQLSEKIEKAEEECSNSDTSHRERSFARKLREGWSVKGMHGCADGRE